MNFSSEDVLQNFERDSIDLVAISRLIYKSRLLILRIFCVATGIGLVIALSAPNIYTAGSTFVVQSAELNSGSSLSSLTGLTGIKIGGLSTRNSGITEELYPQILNSVTFKKNLLQEKINASGKVMTIKEYYDSKKATGLSIGGLIHKYTVGLPGLILEALRKASVEAEEQAGMGPNKMLRISSDDLSYFLLIDSKLVFTQNEKDGVLTLEFSDEDKNIAAEIAYRAKELLQEWIIQYKNQSSKELLDFSMMRYEKSRSEFERLQDSLAIFKDQNLNISSSLYLNKLSRLETKVSIVSSVLGQLASQVEQAKLEVNKNTPVFTTIEPVTIPFMRSSPKRSFIVLIWASMGLMFSVLYILIRKPLTDLFVAIRKE